MINAVVVIDPNYYSLIYKIARAYTSTFIWIHGTQRQLQPLHCLCKSHNSTDMILRSKLWSAPSAFRQPTFLQLKDGNIRHSSQTVTSSTKPPGASLPTTSTPAGAVPPLQPSSQPPQSASIPVSRPSQAILNPRPAAPKPRASDSRLFLSTLLLFFLTPPIIYGYFEYRQQHMERKKQDYLRRQEEKRRALIPGQA